MSSVGLVIARMNTVVPRNIAWAHLVDAELRRSWWAEGRLEPMLGGAVSERWVDANDPDTATRDAVGVVDVFVEGHALGFRWRDRADAHETEVLITLRSGDSGTGITVTETGFGRFSDARERVADAQQGWIDLLTEYVAVLGRVEFVPEAAAAVAAPITSEVEVVEPPAEAEFETDVDEEPEELEVEAEPAVAELVAMVEIVHEDVIVVEVETEVEIELELEAEPEAVEIETEIEIEPDGPEEPDFDSLIRGD